MGEPEKSKTMLLEFFIVKCRSPYNVIIRRTGMRSLGAVGLTIHSMIKFPMDKGVAMIRNSKEALWECKQIERMKSSWKETQWCQHREHMSRIREEEDTVKEKVTIHNDRPNQHVLINRKLSIEYKEKLEETLRRNTNAFAWTKMEGIIKSQYPGWVANAIPIKQRNGFHIEEGIYRSTHMPKGLKNSTATLQRMIDKVLGGQKGRNVEVYLEEVVVKSKTKESLIEDFKEIAQAPKGDRNLLHSDRKGGASIGSHDEVLEDNLSKVQSQSGNRRPHGRDTETFWYRRTIGKMGVDVNLCRLLELGKNDLSLNKYLDQLGTYHSKDGGPSLGLYLFWIVLRYRCARTELITLNLICPSTHQLLWSSGGDFELDYSFDKSASLERLFSLARVSLAGASKVPLSSGCLEGTIPHQWAAELRTYHISYVQRKEAEEQVVQKLFEQEEKLPHMPDKNKEEASRGRLYLIMSPSVVFSLSSFSYFPAMSKNDMKNRVSTLSKSNLKDLVKTSRIPLDLHPRLHDYTFTMDHLPNEAIGIYFEFLWFFGVRIPFSTFLLSVLKYYKNMEDICMDDCPSCLKKWKSKFFLINSRAIPEHLTWRHSHSCVSDDLPVDGYDRNDVERLRVHLICLSEIREEGDAKIVEEPHHLSEPLLEHVPSYTTAPTAVDALISLPTLDDVVVAQPDPRLARKSKGPLQVRARSALVTISEPSQLSKNKRLKKRASEAGSSAPELRQAEGLNEADIIGFCMELEDSMERDEGTSIRVASVLTPRLGKRLGLSSSMAVVSVFGPAHVWTSAPASTSGHSLDLGGSSTGGFVGKSRAEDMRRQMDPLDAWPVVLCLVTQNMTRYRRMTLALLIVALDWTLTPDELRRTESLLLLELSNRVNVLSALLVSYGYELNSRYTDLVSSKVRLQDNFDRKKGVVKLLHSDLDNKLEKVQRAASVGITEELARTDAKLSEQALTVRDLHNELASKRSRSQGYKDVVDELKTEVTQFIGSSMEGLVRRLLSSDKFYAAFAHVSSLGINYGVERGLRMGRSNADFEAAARKVSNFHIGVEADFNKALVAFPTTLFPFLGKVASAAGGALFEVTQILSDKLVVRPPRLLLLRMFSPSIRVSLCPFVFTCVGMSYAVVPARKSASTCPFIALLGAYLMPYSFDFYSLFGQSSRCLTVVQYLAYWLVCDDFVCMALKASKKHLYLNLIRDSIFQSISGKGY
nr:reverse transcriptase domain-containing protein [Tanacetum cinerariifolium]